MACALGPETVTTLLPCPFCGGKAECTNNGCTLAGNADIKIIKIRFIQLVQRRIEAVIEGGFYTAVTPRLENKIAAARQAGDNDRAFTLAVEWLRSKDAP